MLLRNIRISQKKIESEFLYINFLKSDEYSFFHLFDINY